MGSIGKPNYYELLEIAPDATQSEVAKAYQKAKQTYDTENPALYSMFSAEEAKELLKLIDEAYGVLGSAANRREYDQSLGPSAAQPARTPEARVEVVAATPTPAAAARVNTPMREEVGEVKIKEQRTGEDRRASDTGKTQLSTYKIDKEVEAQIAAMSEFNGGALEKVRLYKNISLEKMSELTRISKTYLAAVEANDYKNLPAAVFVRGFIVQMTRALGLDEKKVAESYMKLFKAGGGK
ncbi:MAG: helix-turn-helix domain-containing protein [Bdellovibrionota bacterium]